MRVSSEAIATLVLFVIVFVVQAGAVITGHLPLPHIQAKESVLIGKPLRRPDQSVA